MNALDIGIGLQVILKELRKTWIEQYDRSADEDSTK